MNDAQKYKQLRADYRHALDRAVREDCNPDVLGRKLREAWEIAEAAEVAPRGVQRGST